MKKKWVLVLSLSVGALALTVFLVSRPSNEPSYKGHPLSFGVTGLGRPGATGEEKRESREAVDHIGVAAVPYLVKWIQYEDPTWRGKLSKRVYYAHGVIGWRLALKLMGWVSTPVPEKLSVGSLRAFEVLGKRGEPAFGELCRLLNQTNAPGSSSTAAYALGELGTNSLPVLVGVVGTPGHPARRAAAVAIRWFGPQAVSALPALTNALADPDPDVRKAAMFGIQSIAAAVRTNVPSR